MAHRVGAVSDQPGRFLEVLHEHIVRADLVVTSGGVSQGDYDVVKEALRPLGSMWFGGVRMQPGKSTNFSIRPVAVTGRFRLDELRGPDGKHLAIYGMDGEAVE